MIYCEGFDDITLYRTKDKNKHRASPSGFHLIFENPKLASMLHPNRGEMKESQTTENVEVEVESFFLEDHSDPEENHFVFAYKIRIKNHGSQTVQLLSRHWIITDSNGKTEEVKGEGVVGEQPVLDPGEEFEYTSGSHLKTEMGTMHGGYQMVNDQGESLEVEIPCFTLSVPGILN